MVALGQVSADLFEQLRIDFVVEVIGHACKEICTGHWTTLHDRDARRRVEGATREYIFVRTVNTAAVPVR
ncbi:hypothetical protein GCM10022270_26970 [Terriglobus aquaticus]